MNGVPRNPVNPWMVGLTVLWNLVLAAALVFLILGANAGSLGYDQPGLPPPDVLAGISFACSGVAAAVALVLVGVQLGVCALRWHLDPASRSLAREVASGQPRPARQDF